MYFAQHEIPCEFRILNFTDDPLAAAQLAKETPINRVPYLLDGEQIVFDSRVIIQYVAQKHQLTPLTIDEENKVSAIYSAMDAGVALYLLKRDGIDTAGPGFFLSRQRARIPNNLKFVTPWAESLRSDRPRDWNFASMALYSFLHWGNARQLFQISQYPSLAEFFDRFKDCPGVQGTGF